MLGAARAGFLGAAGTSGGSSNSSLLLAASGSDIISTPNNALFNFGTGNFTVEGWLRITGTAWWSYMGQFDNGSAGWYIDINTSRAPRLVAKDDSTGRGVPITSSTAMSLNTWHHLAVVRNGSTITMYLDGASVGTYAISTNAITDATGIFQAGFSTAGRYFNGNMDETRITKGVARYTTGFTPPTAPFPNSTGEGDSDFASVSALLHFNGSNGSTTITDDSDNSLSFTAGGGAQISTAEFKF